MTPEENARQLIDFLLSLANWDAQDSSALNLHASIGVAVREHSLWRSHDRAGYLLDTDGKVAGVIKAKPKGFTLIRVENHSEKYCPALPDNLPCWFKPLPFLYQSVETRSTIGRNPTLQRSHLGWEPLERRLKHHHAMEDWWRSLTPCRAPLALISRQRR